MASEWTVMTLGSVTHFTSGGTPSKQKASYWSGQIPWLSAKDMKKFLIEDTEDHLSEEGLENGSRLASAGTVFLLARGMTLLNDIPICIARRPMAFNQDVKGLIADNRYLAAEFLPYLLLGHKATLLNIVDLAGHGTGRLNTDELKSLSISVPPRDQQLAIARVLSSLDNKIELSRKMNETLETMMRALFKSWFVDFDPVRAKSEFHVSGHPGHIAALFPDSFEDSELGEIPKGWSPGVLNDFVAHVLGGDWGMDECSPERSVGVRCIRGADIPDIQRGGAGKMPYRYLKPSSAEKRSLTDGDLVIEISGGSPTQSTGRPVLVSNGLLGRLGAPLVCSNFCRFLRLKSKLYSKFIYLWLLTLYANDELLQFENGTTGIKNFAFSLFSSSYKLPVPPLPVVAAFEHLAQPIFLKQQTNAAETETLVAIREALLLKLISGELLLDNARHGAKGR